MVALLLQPRLRLVNLLVPHDVHRLDAVLVPRGCRAPHQLLPEALVGPPPRERIPFPKRARLALRQRRAAPFPAQDLRALGAPPGDAQLRPADEEFERSLSRSITFKSTAQIGISLWERSPLVEESG